MCDWHRFTPIITPLSNRRPSTSRKINAAGPAAPSTLWSAGNKGRGSGGIMRRASEADGAVANALMLGPVQGGNRPAEYYVPQSTPLGPHPSLKGFGRQAAGFKAQFKDAYQTRKFFIQSLPVS